jgi:hypothetical protein
MDAARRSIDAIQFGGFTQDLRDSAAWIRENVATVGQLSQSLDGLNTRLATNVPAGVNAAIPEVRKLTEEFALLKQWVDATIQSVELLGTAVE